MNSFLIAVIIILVCVLLAVTAFMEWVGVMSLFTTRCGPRYDGCGHLKAVVTTRNDRCWRCRHVRLDHALHAPAQHLHHGH
jgi:hypothetical protein